MYTKNTSDFSNFTVTTSVTCKHSVEPCQTDTIRLIVTDARASGLNDFKGRKNPHLGWLMLKSVRAALHDHQTLKGETSATNFKLDAQLGEFNIDVTFKLKVGNSGLLELQRIGAALASVSPTSKAMIIVNDSAHYVYNKGSVVTKLWVSVAPALLPALKYSYCLAHGKTNGNLSKVDFISSFRQSIADFSNAVFLAAQKNTPPSFWLNEGVLSWCKAGWNDCKSTCATKDVYTHLAKLGLSNLIEGDHLAVVKSFEADALDIVSARFSKSFVKRECRKLLKI